MRKLGLPGPPRAHAPPHVLFDSQHYSTLSYSSLGSYFSFLFFTFLTQFNLIYLQLESAPRKRHWLVLAYKKNCLSFYLDETHASEMNWIRSGPPSECTKRPNLGKDISEKNHMCFYCSCNVTCQALFGEELVSMSIHKFQCKFVGNTTDQIMTQELSHSMAGSRAGVRGNQQHW